jgi:hypothetical protein
LRPLGKSLINPELLSKLLDIVEQAPLPAKYSRGRLFTMTFAEVLICNQAVAQAEACRYKALLLERNSA